MATSPLAKNVIAAANKGRLPPSDDVRAIVEALDEADRLETVIQVLECALANASSSDKEAELREQLDKLRQQLDNLLQAPARLGVLYDVHVGGNGDKRALVGSEGGMMDVPLALGDDIEVGHWVGIVTGAEGAFVASTYGPYTGGIDALFIGRENGCLVLRGDRDEILRAKAGPYIDGSELEEGRTWIRTATFGHEALALVVVEEREGDGHDLLKEMRSGVDFSDVAGLDSTVRTVKEKVTLWYRPTLAEMYNPIPGKPILEFSRGILIVGPPGTGKSLITWAIRTFAEELVGAPVAAFELSSAQVLSHWHGKSGKNIMRAAEAVHRAGDPDRPSICCWQDIEDMVYDRKRADYSVTARITNSMNAALDATPRHWFPLATANLPDLIDASTADRWHVVYVGIPDESGVRAILELKLNRTICARPIDETCDIVISAMRGEFLRVTIAGQVRSYSRLALLTGRKIQKAAERAVEVAAIRDATFGVRQPSGVTADDLIEALTEQFANLGRSIVPQNAGMLLALTHEEASQVSNVHVTQQEAASSSSGAAFMRAAS